ncbi:MAG: SPFH domain-containing protein [Muribaculaceae bacterium]|nr:SPFH domain-containing protein [Muribaculaceae bacterium]MDE6542233.1 SPFH domain-containing protein [Muribaculaceae bacterium]
MEKNSEYAYKGTVINGFVMLAVELVLIPMLVGSAFVFMERPGFVVAVLTLVWLVCLGGFFSQQPNKARVMIFFGKYRGTFTRDGFYWVNPFMSDRKLSLRLHNIDIEPIKVNDKVGNPVLIGMVIVWKVKDTYRAVFDVDSPGTAVSAGSLLAAHNHSVALEAFVRIQSDAALREVTGHYAYDNIDGVHDEITLRGGGDEINDLLERKINERLAMAGIEVVEARLNYLAYAPEIAAVMLRRQQAAAIISAREKIVEGAVSMVKMALRQLEEEQVVELDAERKAAMVSNMLVVLCADEPAQPVLNTGSM